MENEQTERQIIGLIAADRMHIPISSLDGKLKRMKPKLAREVETVMPEGRTSYMGERVYARIESEDESKARGTKEGIAQFSQQFPKYGTILKGMIEEERTVRETHLYFGTTRGSRLTADDYLTVMANLGFGETTARSLYDELVDVSRTLAKKRNEERSIMLDTTLG